MGKRKRGGKGKRQLRGDVPSVGRFTPAHGTAKGCGTELVFECAPDGVHRAEPVPAGAQAKAAGKPFDSETARSAALRRWSLAKVPDLVKTELEFTPTEEFAPFDAGRRGLLAAKQDELVATFGAVGVGVMSTARGYAWLVAFAEFYAVRAAKTGNDDDADRARRFFKDASIELAKAHELARAETAASAVQGGTDLFQRQQAFQRQLAARQEGKP
jgi:hypothetical protein